MVLFYAHFNHQIFVGSVACNELCQESSCNKSVTRQSAMNFRMIDFQVCSWNEDLKIE